MKDIDLVENVELRNRYITRTDVLEKVKALSLLPDDVNATVDMVANYYEVGKEAIKTIVKENKEELETDGLKILSRDELRSLKDLSLIPKNSPSLTVIPRRAILRIGMLLRDSVVAKTVRSYLLNVEETAREEAIHLVATAVRKTDRDVRLEIMKINAETRRAKLIFEVTEKFKDKLSPVAIESMLSVGAEYLTGREVIPKPRVEQKFLSCEDIAEKLGIMSEKGNPHKQAVSALIASIEIAESEKMTVVESKGSWQGTAVKYAESIIPRLSQRLDELGRPDELDLGKVFKLRWEIASRN